MNSNLQQYLLEGERVLWQGAPGRWVKLQPQDIFWIPLTLLWTVQVLNSNIGFWPIEMEVTLVFAVVPLFFLLIGLYLTIGRFIHDAIARRYTSYAVTNQRLLIIRSWPIRGAAVHSYDLEYLPSLELKEGRGNRGAIIMCDEDTTTSWIFRLDLNSVLSDGRLEDVENPRQVYELIGQARSQLRSQRGLSSDSLI